MSSIDDLKQDLKNRTDRAVAMGGVNKLERIRDEGRLNARERIGHLLDPGSFAEFGRFATSIRPEVRSKTPADGKITGFGRIDGREVIVCSNDFTVMGASSSTVNGKKIGHAKQASSGSGVPLVFLGESTGARMPDVMGAEGVGANVARDQYRRVRTSPWISAVLGPCYGSSTWYACMSDVVVMRKGAQMAVASPRLSSVATGEETDAEQLAGWKMHATSSGLVDIVVDTDEEALEAVKAVLSYLPSHAGQPAPVLPYEDDPEVQATRAERLADLVPVSRTQVYDMRKVIRTVVDEGSFLELKALYGRSMSVGFARIEGRPVGIIANNPMYKGGAIDAEACSKTTSFIVLCDSFNIPLVMVADQPGFLLGVDGERKAMPGRIMNWMNALALRSVPAIAVVARKTYGQGVLNMGLGGKADEVCAWTTGEIGFMDPVAATTVVHGEDVKNDPEAYEKALAEMQKGTSAYEAAAIFSVQDVIDPRDTRAYLARVLAAYCGSGNRDLSEGLMRSWPTTII